MQLSAALPLLLMTVGAIGMPPLARRLAIPVAVAEILYGFVIGRSALGLIGTSPNAFIEFLADLGFAFFLFLAGMEVDFRGFERRGPGWLAVPAVLSVAAFVLAIGLAWVLGWGPWVGLAVGSTSVPLLLSVVHEERLTGTPLGSTMIGFAAVGETLTIVLISVFQVLHEAHDPFTVVAGLGGLVVVALSVVGAAVGLRAALWWFPDTLTRMVALDDPAEFGVRVGFGLMFAFIGLAMLLGVEPFLGAFFGGLVMAWVIREKGHLGGKLASVAYGFFVPVFFIHVGARLSVTLGLVADNWQKMLAIVVVMMLVKLIPSTLLLTRGLRMGELMATCCLLAAPLTLVIAVMNLGERFEAVDSETEAVVITAGIAASLLYPSMARRLLRGRAARQAPQAHRRATDLPPLH